MDICKGDYGGITNGGARGGDTSLTIVSASFPDTVDMNTIPPTAQIKLSWHWGDWSLSGPLLCLIDSLRRWQYNEVFCFEVYLDGVFITTYSVTAAEWGVATEAEGQAEFGIPLPMPATRGIKSVQIVCRAWARYNYQDVSSFCITSHYQVLHSNTRNASAQVNYVQPKPTAAFSYVPPSGPAPLPVTFTDLSVFPPDVLYSDKSWKWDFGDGFNSTDQNPSHTYMKPGRYTVKLTVSAKGYSDSDSLIINVSAAAVSPILDASCFVPVKVSPGENFQPTIVIDNQGGPGNAFLYFTLGGHTFDIWTSQPLDGYADRIPVTLVPRTIDWYLGYTPTSSVYLKIEVFTGPAGQPITDHKEFELSVIVGGGGGCTVDSDCPAGQVCQNGVCVPAGGGCTIDSDCPAGEVCSQGVCVKVGTIKPWWQNPTVIIGGVAITIGLFLLLSKGLGGKK